MAQQQRGKPPRGVLARQPTSVVEACVEGDVVALRRLLDGSADVDEAQPDGTRPLHMACGYGNIDVAQLCIERGAAVDRVDHYGSTPLHYACEHDPGR